MAPATTYSTSNFFIAAYLVCKGNAILRVDKTDRFNAQIVFNDSTELRKEVDEFWNNNTQVAPAQLYSEYKMIAERVKS